MNFLKFQEKEAASRPAAPTDASAAATAPQGAPYEAGSSKEKVRTS
jgi:hypothetical protein